MKQAQLLLPLYYALTLSLNDVAHGFSMSLAEVKTTTTTTTTSTATTSGSSPHHALFDRRSTLQTIGASSVLLTTLLRIPNPANAAYIDPVVDPPKVTQKVYLDVQIGDKEPKTKTERLTIALFGELMPKTVENFVKLCETNAYVGTTFYRVLSDYNIQGGAVGDPTGKTGQSASGAPFEPDNFNLKHTKTGLVSAVKGVGGGVDSRFFINCNDDGGWADDRYAAFGIVEDDSLAVVKKIEKVDVQRPSNTPKAEIKIVGCGIL